LSVIIVDKFRELLGRAAHVGVTDSAVMRRLGIAIDKKKFARDWMMITGSRAGEELLWLYINRSGEAFDWFMGQGGEAVDATIYTGYYKGPVFNEYPGTHIVFQKPGYDKYRFKYGGQLVVEILERTVLEGGGGKSSAPSGREQLEKDGTARVVSFVAKSETDGRYRRYVGKKGVILATGDIEATANAGGVLPPGAQALGGTVLAQGQQHRRRPQDGLLGRRRLRRSRLGRVHARPRDDDASYYSFFFLFVNSRGRRFMNEDTWTQAKSMRVLAQPGSRHRLHHHGAKWDGDSARVSRSPRPGGDPPEHRQLGRHLGPRLRTRQDRRRHYIAKGRCAWKADTIGELAEKIGVPAENLKATVARYNALYEQGDDVDFGKRAELLTGITEPPFYAHKWGTALLDVFRRRADGYEYARPGPVLRAHPGPLRRWERGRRLLRRGLSAASHGNSFGRALTWGLIVTEGHRGGQSIEDKNTS
jgi:hypothetical protein